MKAYFQTIQTAIRTTLTGARLTFRHFLKAMRKKPASTTIEAATYFKEQEGIITLQYPHEMFVLPDNARYELHNEIEDCIVCDKCAKICPVNCIDIEAIKATEQLGLTSDGTPIRLYAAKFDIDMAKCCFCGLCTTVCPTECLTMTQLYDKSVFERTELTIPFATMTTHEIDEKKRIYEEQQVKKEQALQEKNKVLQKIEEQGNIDAPISPEVPKTRPVFKPKMK